MSEIQAQTPAPPASTFDLSEIKPLVSLRRYWWLSLALLMVLGAISLVAAWFLGAPEYRATAVIHVSPRFVGLVEDSNELDLEGGARYQLFITNQARTINRLDILEKALEDLGEHRALWVVEDETLAAAAVRLQRVLNVQVVNNTYLITVSLDGPEPQGLHHIVNTVAQAYLEIYKQEELWGSGERIQDLRARRTQLLQEIDDKVARRTQLAQELGVTTFVEEGPNAFDQVLVEGSAAVQQARQQRLAAEARLTALADGDASTGVLGTLVAEQLAEDPELEVLRTSLMQRRTLLLTELSSLGPDHPRRRSAQRELEALENELLDLTAERRQNLATQLLSARRAELQEARLVEQGLENQLEIQHQEAARFTGLYNDALILSNDIQRARRQLNQVDDRVDFLVTESEAPGFVRLFSPARFSDIPVDGGRRKYALALGFISLVVALAVPVLLDLMDRRIKTAAQVGRLLGFRPVAAFPKDDGSPWTRALIHDQRRRLALVLARERQDHHTRRLVFTAARAGSGTTTLVLDLAREFSRDGLRSVVVEVNPFRPDARYRCEPPRPGLADVMAGNHTLESAIAPANGPLPERIAVGLTMERHLPGYGNLLRVLEQLGERYDMVLLDAPPILLSADAEFLVGNTDGVCLVVGAGETHPGEVQRAATLLERGNPPLVTVVVTQLSVYHGGGYYEQLLDDYQASDTASRQLAETQLPQLR